MARATIIIAESAEQITALLERRENAPYAGRLRMLALLKADPARTLDAVASQLGISPRSIYRWWGIYRKEGLAGLLGGDGLAVPKRGKMGERELEELKLKLLAGELDGLKEIREWVEKTYGVKYSLKGISEVLRRMGMQRRWSSVGEGYRQNIEPAAGFREISELINQLPVTLDVREWILRLRDCLMGILVDVDRISISVNVASDVSKPEEYFPKTFICQANDPSLKSTNVGVYDFTSNKGDSLKMLIEEFVKNGFPIADYQDPYVQNYFFQSAYIGRIILWRYRTRPRISASTVRALQCLYPILVLVMSDVILRHGYVNPAERGYYAGYYRITDECHLSIQERSALTYRMFGCSYKEISSHMNIAEDTVKKLIRSLHKKTKTRSHVELVAKYFTPRFFSQEDS